MKRKVIIERSNHGDLMRRRPVMRLETFEPDHKAPPPPPVVPPPVETKTVPEDVASPTKRKSKTKGVNHGEPVDR